MPLPAMKCAAISIVVILAALFAIDRVVLPGLERRGLTSGESWARHNALVIAEHQLEDRTIPIPEAVASLVPVGVRSWAGQPVTVNRGPGAKRILVMGDSFVWGSPYLSLNHMWWRQLGQILEENSVEVIAAGRPGASTRDQLKWAKYLAPIYQPDLIIWGYVTNDADEGLIRQINMSQQSIPKMDRVRNLARQIWPRVTAKFDAMRNIKLEKMYTGPVYGYEYFEWELKLVEPHNLTAYAKTVAELKSFLDETQIPSFMMTLPNFPSTEYFEPRMAPIIKIWHEAGIAAYDTVDEFVRRYGETPRTGNEAIRWGINPADGHPGPRPCRFLAEQAAEIVRRDFSNTLGVTAKLSVKPVINDWLPNLESNACPHSAADGQSWKMQYPTDETRWPKMPLELPTVLLAFRRPIALRSLRLSGPAIRSARVWVTCLDAKELYDDGIEHDLGEREGQEIDWTIPPEFASQPISTVRFRAAFASSERELTWSFEANMPEAK